MADRALLVGINDYPEMPLRQCVKDVMRTLNGIQWLFDFAPEGIRILINHRATTENILARLGWLVKGAMPGDRLLFHFSGHGTQVPSVAGNEVDGLDEVVCPIDFDWSDRHMIRDDQFNDLFKTVPRDVQFTWVSDSCHSGNLDRYVISRGRWYRPNAAVAMRVGMARGKGIRGRRLARVAQGLNCAFISACAENELAEETDEGGVLTSALWDAIEAHPTWSLTRLVDRARRRAAMTQAINLVSHSCLAYRQFLEA